MLIQSWTDVLVSSLQNLWIQVLSFLPSLVGALVIFIVGLIVAAGLGSLVEKVIAALRLDDLLKKLGLDEYARRANIELNSGHFLGKVVYWFLVLAFLLAASDILGFFALSNFLRDVLLYIPNVAVAVLIMLAAVVLANFLRNLARASVASAKLHGAHFLGTLSWWAVVLFGFFAALVQLGVAVTVVNSLVVGFIAMLALAGGLAFGLGGRSYAEHLIDELRRHTEGK